MTDAAKLLKLDREHFSSGVDQDAVWNDVPDFAHGRGNDVATLPLELLGDEQTVGRPFRLRRIHLLGYEAFVKVRPGVNRLYLVWMDSVQVDERALRACKVIV